MPMKNIDDPLFIPDFFQGEVGWAGGGGEVGGWYPGVTE